LAAGQSPAGALDDRRGGRHGMTTSILRASFTAWGIISASVFVLAIAKVSAQPVRVAGMTPFWTAALKAGMSRFQPASRSAHSLANGCRDGIAEAEIPTDA